MRVLSYATDGATTLERRHRMLPRWLVIGSIGPIPTFILIAYTSGLWSSWLGIGQAWERATGTMWLGTAGVSLAWVCLLALCHKRSDVWAAMSLHGLFVATTVLPPCSIAIAWLMHWLSGTGA